MGVGSIPRIETERVNCLWVRWFQFNEGYPLGFVAKRLPRVFFMDPKDPAAFDFLDPLDIIRAAHIIPAFHYSDVEEEDPELVLPPSSIARRELEEDDWSCYYINMIVDHDTLMLFSGGGVGHQHLHEYLQPFAIDTGLVDQNLPTYDSDGNTIDGSDDEIQSDIGDGEGMDNDEEDIGCSGDKESDPDDPDDLENDNEAWLGPEDGEERVDSDSNEELGL
ncbi:hypothetical protein BT96DRAFT_876633 [Gymnopus androsaceus JB14]|uniref:Uncharacterized protein n=1 Tax=Gymnopus androsaceus JB14 TaxID=1447944 RepID=A0A6A4IA89_9AGAR|nr:hypothetical protein BT96DRAFT_876633 [Gymnopus androsaceus JB14]